MKIKKNLSDEEMLARAKEKITFENTPGPEQPVKSAGKEPAKEHTFFTAELQEKVDRALLELKIKLYKQGIVDYKIKVSCEGNQVILTALPVTGGPKTAGRKGLTDGGR